MTRLPGISDRFIMMELFCTRYCTYNCEHCMYDCGPHESKEYMSDEILAKVKKQVDFLKQLEAFPIINLIGGEPTINLNKFEHILKQVATWNVGIMMTTNGWWLNSRKSTERFLKIVSPYAYIDGKSRRYKFPIFFDIRISDDEAHYKKRKVKDIQQSLNEIFSDTKFLSDNNIPVPDKEDPWIWKQQHFLIDGLTTNYIAPNGRGRNVTNIDEHIKRYSKDGNYCHKNFNAIESIHYEPDGKISDTCGYGSMYDFGTVDDNLIFILELIWEYKKERWQNRENQNFTCWNCREMVHKWKEENLEKYRAFLSPINTMNIDKFIVNFRQ